jgi:membrane protein DedA with SNARE-associated domain
MYNTSMSKQPVQEKIICETNEAPVKAVSKKTSRMALAMGIIGVILTVAMFVAIIVFNEEVKEMQRWGYLGAFFISLLGGATIIIPVPMLAVIVALASALGTPWEVALLGFSSAAGELLGALIIYYTGHGAGRAISSNKHGRIQKAYEKMLGIIERRGALALFAVTFIINPFFYPAAFACGALRFGLRKFIVIVIIGKLIKCMSIVYASYYGLKGIFRAIGIDI